MNIEELKQLAEAATPGPWVSHPKGYYGAVCRAVRFLTFDKATQNNA